MVGAGVIVATLAPASAAVAPWDEFSDPSDGPPQVLFHLLGYPITDFFLVTFIIFAALAFVFWAFFESVGDDRSGVS